MNASLTFTFQKEKLMSVTFKRDKETKNTVRFTAPAGNEISGSIYIAKDSDLAKENEISVEVSENAVVAA